MKIHAQLCAGLALIIGCICSTAHARLGETVAEIEKRYGTPVVTNATKFPEGTIAQAGALGQFQDLPATNYFFKDYVVTVAYKDGKSITECVMPRLPRAMTIEECNALVTAIVGKEIPQFGTYREGSDAYWRAPEGVAIWDRSTSELSVLSGLYSQHLRERDERLKKEKADKDKKRADGF